MKQPYKNCSGLSNYLQPFDQKDDFFIGTWNYLNVSPGWTKLQELEIRKFPSFLLNRLEWCLHARIAMMNVNLWKNKFLQWKLLEIQCTNIFKMS